MLEKWEGEIRGIKYIKRFGGIMEDELSPRGMIVEKKP
jgi:hypothetical protein